MPPHKYDLAEVIATENIHRKFAEAVSKNEPFMVFRIPGRDIDLVNVDDKREFLIKPWQQEAFSLHSEKSGNQTLLTAETSKEEYALSFKKYKDAFASGSLKKAILSGVIHKEKPQNFDPIGFFLGLCESYPDAFSYLLHHPKTGTWCGATPEVLLEGKGEEFITVALAGTQSAHPSGEYHWEEKEREEQELVSQHIRETLQYMGANDIEESVPKTVQAADVVHLKTEFRFHYEKNIKSLLDRLHPTPAVAGLPIADSIKLISDAENHHRGLYTGYIGILSEKETRVFVNLRCMQIGERELALYVGGGITAKSNIEPEWEETRMKAKTLLNLLKSTT